MTRYTLEEAVKHPGVEASFWCVLDDGTTIAVEVMGENLYHLDFHRDFTSLADLETYLHEHTSGRYAIGSRVWMDEWSAGA